VRRTAAALLLALLAGPAWAADPPDMLAAAHKYADQAPTILGVPRLGEVQIPNYATAQFRGVRANYKRFEVVNDRIVFCGEVNFKDPRSGAMSGWTRFAYLPGDPPILVSPLEGFGLREVGKPVLHNMCETGQEAWLSTDFTPDFQKPPNQQRF
jgi:hypothetical protein